MAGKKEKEKAEEKKEKGRGRDNEKKNNSIKCINKRKMKITKLNEKFILAKLNLKINLENYI